MTPENFIYWLQGFAESKGDLLSKTQWEDIKEQLSLVYIKPSLIDAVGKPTLYPNLTIDPPYTETT